ncbi:hypothetical protein DAEQUDRAFT_316004 [Daedalea quercina L-15889]|uniref:Uncharacterized protein n=1 Tax=Daedalea quercina L-15889 TaxID=1314783 RepID=A0A165PWB7_9APHY|nr:hypothetical protein DAEQUDRAFT_316004 [Daedalea quercina L-15889]
MVRRRAGAAPSALHRQQLEARGSDLHIALATSRTKLMTGLRHSQPSKRPLGCALPKSRPRPETSNGNRDDITGYNRDTTLLPVRRAHSRANV